MTRLHDLFDQQGQSPWLDNLCRDDIDSGHLQELIHRGVRGITSNPTIFHRSITTNVAYDREIEECRRSRLDAVDSYWRLVMTDVRHACDFLGPIHQESNGDDGFVSLEVDPHLADDAVATVQSATHLVSTVKRPNLMIKIPATDAGIVAIETLLSQGVSVNVTLIFGLERYRQVLAAFRSGIQRLSRSDPSRVSQVRSVASFFVSRVDTTVDQRLRDQQRSDLVGRTAISQARLAYEVWQDFFANSGWSDLARAGARPQRPLWASTSTKDPEFSELIYVEELIGSDTVNTLPEPTLLAFEDHGVVARSIDQKLSAAHDHVREIEDLGIRLDEVARTLETAGVRSFQQSFDDLLAALSTKLSS